MTEKKSSYPLNDLKNFNEIFRNNVIYLIVDVLPEKKNIHWYSGP